MHPGPEGRRGGVVRRGELPGELPARRGIPARALRRRCGRCRAPPQHTLPERRRVRGARPRHPAVPSGPLEGLARRAAVAQHGGDRARRLPRRVRDAAHRAGAPRGSAKDARGGAAPLLTTCRRRRRIGSDRRRSRRSWTSRGRRRAATWRAAKEVLAGIGDDVDGSTVVGLVFGPQRWFATPAPGGLFEALALAYQPADG